MKNLSLFFTILFIVFAAVQYNDEDAALWILVYGVAAAASFMAYRGKSDKILLLVILACSIFGIYEFLPAEWIGVVADIEYQTGKSDIGHSSPIELARESLGFAIVALASIIFLINAFRSS